jgi:hypothetical protein
VNEPQSPRNWNPPTWHSDFGDPNLEFEHLKAFSTALLSVQPNATVGLETPEPGLMDVHVQLPDGMVAEVYSVQNVEDPGKRRLAIFLAPGSSEEEEIYADTIPSALSHFRERLHSPS